MMSAAETRAALACIPPDLPRDDWARIAMALKSELGEAGFNLFDAWSATGDSYAPRAVRDTWRSIKAGGRVTIGTLLHMAQQHGFKRSEPAAPPSPEALKGKAAERAERDQQEQAARQAAQAKAAQEAQARFSEASDTGASAYLDRKGVGAHGVRYTPDGALRVPMRGLQGELRNLQTIKPDGTKRYLPGGQKTGLLHWIGNPEGAPVLILAEGYATAATVYEATARPAACCFDTSNLAHVARALRSHYGPGVLLLIAADNDRETEARTGKNPGRIAAEATARNVGGFVAVPDAPEGRNVDFNDLAASAGLDRVKACIEAAIAQALAQETPEPSDETDGKERISQASLLVQFVQESAKLFHDENKAVYARDTNTGEVRRIDGRQFRDWLQASFFESTEKAARDQSLREAISTLSGLGRFKGECLPVSVRVGLHEGAYYLDLAISGQSRAVMIEPGRWEIVDNPPIMFLRTESMRPLPEPVQGGDLSALWKLVNIPEDVRLLVLAWLADCLRPETPFPVLELIGEQGSAKSTTQTVLRKLIDPNACDLRAAPKSAEDVFVGAGVNWLVSYENVSHLPSPMQDALCVLATGGGFAKRKLYSDADEAVIQTKRPIVLNSISAVITAQDLIDRSISIETPVIATRTETTAIWAEFDRHHARLIGAFLDVFAAALQRLPRVKLPTADRPRLIEFAHLGIAIAEATGKTGADFMRQFNQSRQESIARTIDASPVATALIDWFSDRGEQSAEMPVKTLFNELDRFKPSQTDAWPRSAKGFGDAMRRAAPALRSMGIECKSLGKIGSTVKWSISRGKSCDPSRECRASRADALQTGAQHDITTFTTSQRELSPAQVAADDESEVL